MTDTAIDATAADVTGNPQAKTVTLDDALGVLEARHREVQMQTINLQALRVRGDGRFQVDGLDFFVPNEDQHPIRQLCSTVGMPYPFYQANPGALNTTIFETRFKGLDEDSPTATRQLRYRETADGLRVLGLLPHNHVQMPYLQTVRGMATALQGTGGVVRLSNISRLDDDHHLHLRVSFPDLSARVQEGDDVELGLLTLLSEDGFGTRAQISLFLYQLICSNGAVATYGEQNLLDFDYRGIAKFAVEAIINEAQVRAGQDLKWLHARCLDSSRIQWTKEEAVEWLLKLEQRRDVAKTFVRKVRRELLAKEADTFTRWDVISELTLQSQRLPVKARLQHEATAGRLLGLDLPTSENVH